jgi:hypothetical protein
MLELGLCQVFLNITIALCTFVTLLTSMASVECTFSVLKQVKNYCHSTMGQDHLNSFVLLSVNCDLAPNLDLFLIINTFSEKKARKVFVK